MPAFLLVTPAIAPSAAAQTLQDEAREVAQTGDLGHIFTTLGILGSTPGISSGQFHSDMDITSYKLPVGYSFGKPNDSLRFRAELTLSRVDAKHVVSLHDPQAETIRLNYKSYTVLIGLGADIGVGPALNLRTMALAGYSSTSGDARASGPVGENLVSATEGILAEMKVENGLAGGSLELAYSKTEESGMRVKGSARYNLLYSIPAKESDPSLRTEGVFSVATINGELRAPTGKTLFARDLHWLGFVKGTALIGEKGAVLGFDKYAEIGGGLELMRPVPGFPRLEGITLYGSIIKGPNVTGWTLGLGLDL